MTPEEHASFHRDSADAIELVHRHGIPSGYQLQYYSDELKTWRNCLTTNGIYLYRLVELPQQTAVPYDRKTWPMDFFPVSVYEACKRINAGTMLADIWNMGLAPAVYRKVSMLPVDEQKKIADGKGAIFRKKP